MLTEDLRKKLRSKIERQRMGRISQKEREKIVDDNLVKMGMKYEDIKGIFDTLPAEQKKEILKVAGKM